jgi:tetratricopeptide (TPR) repeat protein
VELGLDWDAPPFPDVGGGTASSLELTVDRGNIDVPVSAKEATDRLRCQGDLVGALAAIRKGQAAAPDDADLNNYLAWFLIVRPDPNLRDARQAVELARKAAGAEPDYWTYRRTLGVAHHFAGEDRAAVKALTRSLELNPSGEAFDYFPLAAAYQQIGNKEEARKWYDRGVAWMAANKHPHAAELAVLRADAEARLGIEKPSLPGPDRTPPEPKE